MKRILIVTEVLPPKYGGADIAGFRYAQNLNSRGSQVMLLGSWNDDFKKQKKDFPFLVAIKYPKLPFSNWRVKRYVDIINFGIAYLFTFFKIWGLRNSFDVLHSMNSYSYHNLAAISIAKFFGKKVVTESCLLGADDPKTIFKKKQKDWLSVNSRKRDCYKKADFFIAKSAQNLSWFEGFIPKEKYGFVNTFVDTSKFLPPQNKESKRLAMDLPRDKKLLIFIGELNRRKGVNLLLETFTNLSKSRKDLFLLLIGPSAKNDQEFTSELQSQMQQLNSNHYLHINKVISNVHDYLPCADILILPSFREGFPNVVIEAMSSGVIVLASDIPEIKNAQIQHGKNGFLFKTGDQQDLEHQLASIIENLDSLDEFKTTVSKEAHNKYSIEVIADKYQQIYKSL